MPVTVPRRAAYHSPELAGSDCWHGAQLDTMALQWQPVAKPLQTMTQTEIFAGILVLNQHFPISNYVENLKHPC